MICFCKALANGYNVSALCGKEFLKNTISSMSYTGSYWLSAVPFAAGIACIEKMKRIDCPRLLNELGTKLKNGLTDVARSYGYDLHVTGAPSLFYLRLADDPSLKLHQRWIAECVKRGVFFTNHHNHFINASLTDDDINETVQIAAEAFEALNG
jgi:glutamate-1-semialdehyde 2,1-aminomutase